MSGIYADQAGLDTQAIYWGSALKDKEGGDRSRRKESLDLDCPAGVVAPVTAEGNGRTEKKEPQTTVWFWDGLTKLTGSPQARVACARSPTSGTCRLSPSCPAILSHWWEAAGGSGASAWAPESTRKQQLGAVSLPQKVLLMRGISEASPQFSQTFFSSSGTVLCWIFGRIWFLAQILSSLE